jgi:hypothetical protein
MGGWMAYLLLFIWMFLYTFLSPDPAAIRDACAGHGRTVAYDGGGALSGPPLAVCSDGHVVGVD